MPDSPTKQSISIISRHAPYGCHKAQQSLDIALAAAVFEQKVNYIFMDDGVYQLIGNQNATGINSKTLSAALETLDLYGIENIYIDADSLEQRGLSQSDLALQGERVNRKIISDIIESSDTVFNL